MARNAILNTKQLWDIPVPYVLEDSLGEWSIDPFPWSLFIHCWGMNNQKINNSGKCLLWSCIFSVSRYKHKGSHSAGLWTFPFEDMYRFQAQTVWGILPFSQKESRVNLFFLPKHNLQTFHWSNLARYLMLIYSVFYVPPFFSLQVLLLCFKDY